MIRHNRAQSMMEYVVLISVVTAAVVYMYPHLRRGNQSLVKAIADQIGNQANADQDFNGMYYTQESNSAGDTYVNASTQTRAGRLTRIKEERTNSFSSSITNAGFTED